eukprot:GHUV01017275.1.p2 GENE.GHUV01017275.1~~GHUV01017275.1.p2  ORF type:complete len:104 (-),score=24.19 GHUV01017275.1:2431-2742(-)
MYCWSITATPAAAALLQAKLLLQPQALRLAVDCHAVLLLHVVNKLIHQIRPGSCLVKVAEVWLDLPRELIQLHPSVLADCPVMVFLQELTPVIYVLPAPVINI